MQAAPTPAGEVAVARRCGGEQPAAGRYRRKTERKVRTTAVGLIVNGVAGGAKAWNSSPLRAGLTGVVKSNLSRLPCCSKMNCENGL